MATTWTVEAPDAVVITPRFADAVRTFTEAQEPKRLLRDGRPLRVQTAPDQLDLFEETTDIRISDTTTEEKHR